MYIDSAIFVTNAEIFGVKMKNGTKTNNLKEKGEMHTERKLIFKSPKRKRGNYVVIKIIFI